MEIATIFLAVFSLLQLSAAQPNHRGQRHVHQRHAHRRAFIPKRDKVTVTDPALAAPTELPEVIVYVDQFGNPVSTATETVAYVPLSTSSSSTSTNQAALPPTKAPVSPDALQAPTVYAASPNSPSQAPVSTYAQAKPSSTAAAAPVPSTGGGGSLHGVTYSPYKGSGGCKTSAEVDTDFAVFAKDTGVVRLYGVDCDQVAFAYAAAKKYGNKLFLGIFDLSSVSQAVSAMAAGVNNDWSVVDTVSVGNELVNNGGATVDRVLGAISQARSALRAAGYQGPVVTVDTFNAATNNPELCNQSDYCAVNVHPFFDPNTGADQAGSFVVGAVERLRAKLTDPNKRIVVTETGWPWKGNANGAAVPGMDTQAAAISSIKSAYSSNPGDLILFTAFNDPWKQAAAGTFYAEQFWGIGGRYSSCDQ
ncbi:hypothetical protein JX265_009145 [Neoarthrinium moseri]|uniref:Cell wall glucanase n=1 Tax=Neoarthrinium moseri TaxID=1658444 RepID=A0A9P9WGI2_9PEZI|nr:hypothetical protein JX265_009145 [Neoarthrinium moseri]